MSFESGKSGLVKIGANTILDVTNWEFNREVVTSRFGSSSVAGFKQTVAGQKMAAGSIKYKHDAADSATVGGRLQLEEGLSVTLLLYRNATDFWTVAAVIKSNNDIVNIDDGTVTEGTATFESNGSYTFTNA